MPTELKLATFLGGPSFRHKYLHGALKMENGQFPMVVEIDIHLRSFNLDNLSPWKFSPWRIVQSLFILLIRQIPMFMESILSF